jgi:Zn-dependent M28 family amino/carboxypeptidase
MLFVPANAYTKLDLDYRFNDPKDPNHFYERSDHYNFAKLGIPSVFSFNGVHADYHKPTDSPDKIEYDALAKRTQFAFVTAWELANETVVSINNTHKAFPKFQWRCIYKSLKFSQ